MLASEEFVEFMKNPIRKEKRKNVIQDTLNPDQIEETQELPKLPWYDECIPDMISQEEVKTEPYHRKSDCIMENCYFEHKGENKGSCANRLDLDSPLNYAVVPEHVANCVTAVQVPLLSIYSMKVDIETFPKINHFEYVPFSSKTLLEVEKAALRRFGMCPMSYHLNEEWVLLNYKRYVWCQDGYTNYPTYKVPLGYILSWFYP